MVGKYFRGVNTVLAARLSIFFQKLSYAPRNKQGHLSTKEYHDYCQRIEKGRDDYIPYYTRYTRFILMNLIFLAMYVYMVCWVRGGCSCVWRPVVD